MVYLRRINIAILNFDQAWVFRALGGMFAFMEARSNGGTKWI
jgi:hypothetical protein